jgi:hypothetical protein
MATKRYLMISVDEGACKDGYQDVLRDLITIPEVQAIERLDGIFDLVVEVECPAGVGCAAADDLLAKAWVKQLQMLSVVNKILAKGWVKRFQVLQVEPAESREPIRAPALDATKGD